VHDWEKNVLVVAQELIRQTEAFRSRYGEEAWGKDSEAVKGFASLIEGIQQGHISVEDAAAEIQSVDERLEADIAAADDPALAMPKRSEIKAKAKGLSHLAHLLAWDASRSAAAGTTKEEWIMQVLAGHIRDQETQIACLKCILVLWEQGPWPWQCRWT
jgi:hypothetical protein